MSYIDCYKHELVGLFGHLPVYHPLETIAGSGNPNDEEFPCLSSQLVLGGGGGEHPGLVLLSPERAVAEFILYNPEMELPDEVKKIIWKQYVAPNSDFLFSAWSSRDHHDFYKMCTGTGLPNRYDPDGEIGFETWLLLGFGEFVFYAMPELAPHSLIEKVSGISKPQHIHYNNILIVPPRMPVYANTGNAFFKNDN